MINRFRVWVAGMLITLASYIHIKATVATCLLVVDELEKIGKEQRGR